jgi:hypothetical protein
MSATLRPGQAVSCCQAGLSMCAEQDAPAPWGRSVEPQAVSVQPRAVSLRVTEVPPTAMTEVRSAG